MSIRQITIIGTGLIGGSLALALKKQRFNAAFYSGVFDPLKREIFFEPARWHSRPLNKAWARVETHALATLISCVFPPSGVKNIRDKLIENAQLSKLELYRLQVRLQLLHLRVHLLRLMNVIMAPVFRCIFIVRSLWISRTIVGQRVYEILHGDRFAWKRATWRFRQASHYLLGRRFSEPEP